MTNNVLAVAPILRGGRMTNNVLAVALDSREVA